MFMTNIPRRKIYETMLIYEDGIIDMQILLLNQENFDKFIDNFNNESINKISEAYLEIKALLVMFFENKKYPLNEGFEEDLRRIMSDEKSLDNKLKENKNIPQNFKKIIEETRKILEEKKKIKTLKEGYEMYEILDAFNSHIPKLLEIRRDEMK